MEIQDFKFKISKAKKHNRHSLLIKLLLTIFSTTIILTLMVYGVKNLLKPIPTEIAQIEQQSQTNVAIPEPKLSALYPTAPDSTILVKASKTLTENPQRNSRSAPRTVEKTHLKTVKIGDPLRDFVKTEENKTNTYSAKQNDDLDGKILLTPSDLTKKIKVEGAKPISIEQAKRYADTDYEAEELREMQLMKDEKAELTKKQILLEKLGFLALVTLLGLAVMLLGSRIILALRLIKKPEGKHWTLK
jgi:hypothetical protein